MAKTSDCIRDDTQLFSESNSRYIVEIAPENYDAVAKIMLNVPFGQLGKVTDNDKLTIKNSSGKAVIDLDTQTLKAAWQKPLDLG